MYSFQGGPEGYAMFEKRDSDRLNIKQILKILKY